MKKVMLLFALLFSGCSGSINSGSKYVEYTNVYCSYMNNLYWAVDYDTDKSCMVSIENVHCVPRVGVELRNKFYKSNIESGKNDKLVLYVL